MRLPGGVLGDAAWPAAPGEAGGLWAGAVLTGEGDAGEWAEDVVSVMGQVRSIDGSCGGGRLSGIHLSGGTACGKARPEMVEGDPQAPDAGEQGDHQEDIVVG